MNIVTLVTFIRHYLTALFSIITISACGGGGGENLQENAIKTPLPALISTIEITGEWAVGQTLNATISCTECLPSMHEYSWSINGKNISITDSYTLTSYDIDKSIRIEVSVNNDEGLADNAYQIITPIYSNHVVDIHKNGNAFAAFKSDNSVVSWGSIGSNENNIVFPLKDVTKLLSTGRTFAAFKENGTVVMWGDEVATNKVSSLDLKDTVKMYSNSYHYAALKADGTVITWAKGEEPDSSGLELTNISKVYRNDGAFAALKTDGTVVTWGYIDVGGNGTVMSSGVGHSAPNNYSSPVDLTEISEIYSTEEAFAALKTDGTVVTWGRDYQGGDSSKVDLTDIKQVYSNNSAFAALKNNGTVVTWGSALYGGNGTVATWESNARIIYSNPVDLTNIVEVFSTSRAFAGLKTDGTMVTWGEDIYGGDSSMVELTNITKAYGNQFSFAAMTKDSSLVTWGDSKYGGDSSGVDLLDINGVYYGPGVFLAQKQDGSAVSWGRDEMGGDSSSVNLDNVINIFPNTFSVAALKSDYSVVTWGYSNYGGDSSAVAEYLRPTVKIVINETSL